MTVDHSISNPYASPSDVGDMPIVSQPIDADGKWTVRVLVADYILLLASILVATAAVINIRTIAFASMIIGPMCVLLMIVIHRKRLPSPLAIVPLALLVFIAIIFLVINLWNLSPNQAQVPIGQTCVGMAVALQPCWIALLKVRRETRQRIVAEDEQTEASTRPH